MLTYYLYMYIHTFKGSKCDLECAHRLINDNADDLLLIMYNTFKGEIKQLRSHLPTSDNF